MQKRTPGIVLAAGSFWRPYFVALAHPNHFAAVRHFLRDEVDLIVGSRPDDPSGQRDAIHRPKIPEIVRLRQEPKRRLDLIRATHEQSGAFIEEQLMTSARALPLENKCVLPANLRSADYTQVGVHRR